MVRLATVDFVVPVAVKFVTPELDPGDVLIRNLDPRFIGGGVQLGRLRKSPAF